MNSQKQVKQSIALIKMIQKWTSTYTTDALIKQIDDLKELTKWKIKYFSH